MGLSMGWNVLIVLATAGGLLGLYFLTYRKSTKRRSEDEPGHVWDEDLAELHNPLPRWWVIMFYLTMIFAVVYLALYPGLGSLHSMLGWSSKRQYQEEMHAASERYGPLFERFASTPIETLSVDPEARAMGERLFAAYCATCHGADARGGVGFPNLTDDDWLYGGDPKSIETTILDGRRGAMPPWGSVLGDEGIEAVTQYVLSLSGRSTSKKQVEAGKAKFQQLCVACHGPLGRGNPRLGAPNLTDDIWLYGGNATVIAQTVSHGRQGTMPAHRDFLGTAKVHLLAAYVHGLGQRR